MFWYAFIDIRNLDLRTQLSQQLMDEKFFGIIVSCFDSHNDNVRENICMLTL